VRYQNPVTYPTVRCLECGEIRYIMTKNHLETAHNMTKQEYLKKHKEHRPSEFWGTHYGHWRARKKHQEAIENGLA
jgi:predicted transcriptional regulator